MIASEKKLVLVKKNYVTAGVARCGNGQDICVKFNLILLFQNQLDSESFGSVIEVHNSFATKLSRKPLMIGYVIPVSKQHPPYAAHLMKTFHQVASKAWRINQYVAAFAVWSDY